MVSRNRKPFEVYSVVKKVQILYVEYIDLCSSCQQFPRGGEEAKVMC